MRCSIIMSYRDSMSYRQLTTPCRANALAVRHGHVTLLFGPRDARHNNAVAHHRYLTERA